MTFKFKNKGFKNQTYAQLLASDEWLEKRLKILNRDNFSCLKCLNQATEIRKVNGKYFAIGDNKLIVADGLNVLVPKISFYEKPNIMHVHHKYYMLSKLPWEYDEEDLVTLCNNCHNDLHSKTFVPVYLDERKILIEDLTECYRCSGLGYIEDYNHVENGICFRCKGAKYLELADAIFKN